MDSNSEYKLEVLVLESTCSFKHINDVCLMICFVGMCVCLSVRNKRKCKSTSYTKS